MSTLDMDPSKIDQAISQLEEEDVPKFKQLDGFKGMTVVADRDSGTVIGVTFWESEEAMKASEEDVKDARQRAADTGGAGEPKVAHMEVLLDTMV